MANYVILAQKNKKQGINNMEQTGKRIIITLKY
jgi:hypothetical protein